MLLAAAQFKAVASGFSKNLEIHKKLVEAAATKSVRLVLFPELSLTGYELNLPKDLKFQCNDARLDSLQSLAIRHDIHLLVGVPCHSDGGIGIGQVLLRPNGQRELFLKKHLHSEERPFFVCGNRQESCQVTVGNARLGLAICFEITKDTHIAQALSPDVCCLVACVAKTPAGIGRAHQRLSEIAKRYERPVIVSNFAHSDSIIESGGGSSAFDSKGKQLCEMDESVEGLLLFDIEHQQSELLELTPEPGETP